MTDQNEQAHDHEHEGDEVLGMAVGFRIFEEAGALYLAEAEISPYEDDPTALGVTLVFHALAGIDPTSGDDEEEEPIAFDFDDELTRDEKAPLVEQTQDILRQLSKLSEQALAEYIRSARDDQDQS